MSDHLDADAGAQGRDAAWPAAPENGLLVETCTRVLRVAAVHYRAPLALVTLVGGRRAWSLASPDASLEVGLDDGAALASFAAPALARPERVLVVPDLRQDARFAAHPWVAGAPGVRAYLGATVVLPDGRARGVLAVVDQQSWSQAGAPDTGPLADLAGLLATALVASDERRELVAARVALEHARATPERAAGSDPHTGLPGRRVLHERLEAALALARRTGHGVTLGLLELGGAAGEADVRSSADAALWRLAASLAGSARDHDVVARIGDDAFALVWQALEASAALSVAERTYRVVMRDQGAAHDGPGDAGGERGGRAAEAATSTGVIASLGLACFPDDAEDALGLLRAADLAMYRAKRAGGGVVRYDPRET